MRRNCILVAASAAVTLTCATAQVFPSIPYARTFDLLVGERADENILRLRDLDQNGDYNGPGESLTFFTSQPLIGPPTPSGIALDSQTGLACAPNGTVYAVDSTGDQIVQLRDLNGDGDADDAGEAIVWFSSAGNGSGIALGSAQSLAVDALGRVFVLTANGGTPVVGFDGILLVEDIDQSGTAQDMGEASYYCLIPNASGAVAHSNPTEFALAPDGSIYYGDIGTLGPIAKGIYRAFDADASGTIDAGEVTLWWVPPFSGAAWYGMVVDFSGYLYVTNHSGVAPLGRSIYRAFDTDASGAIDPGEEQQVYGAASGIWWDLGRRDDGVLLMIDSTPDQLLALKDLTADGDFLDAGEVTVAFDADAAGFPSADLRTFAFMRAPSLEMVPPTVPIGQSTNFVIQTAEPFDFAVSLGALFQIPAVSLPPFGHLEIDPGTLIIFNLGISNLASQSTFQLNLANDPALIGSYGCQAWCGELSRLFLSNGAPLVITP